MRMSYLVIIMLPMLLLAACSSSPYTGGNPNQPVACPMDAKICPDGSSVGRIAPSCDFAPCPQVQNNQSAQGTGQPPAPKTYSVDISNFAFGTSELNIKKGDTVVWTNKDSASHTVTSDSGTELNSPTIATGQAYSHTFSTAGTFSYHCSFHPSMNAKVNVG